MRREVFWVRGFKGKCTFPSPASESNAGILEQNGVRIVRAMAIYRAMAISLCQGIGLYWASRFQLRMTVASLLCFQNISSNGKGSVTSPIVTFYVMQQHVAFVFSLARTLLWGLIWACFVLRDISKALHAGESPI